MPQEERFAPGHRRRDTSGRLWELVRYDEDGESQWVEVVDEGGGGSGGRSGSGREKVPLGFLRTAAQGASFGFSDELAGLLGGLTPGGPRGFRAGYKEGVEGEREKLHAYREQNPLGAIGAEALGGVATGFGLAGGARAVGARLLPRAVGLAGKAKPGFLARLAPGAGQRSAQATRTAQVAEEGGGLAGRMLGSAGIGAAEGAVYGVGVGEENLKSRVTSGLLGAGTGAIVAPVMTAGIAGFGAGKGFLGDLFRGHAGKAGVRSRQIKTDEMLAKSFIQQAPEKARLRGAEWVKEMEYLANAGPKTRDPVTGRYVTAAKRRAARGALSDMADSGNAQNYAAIRGAAADAAAREAVPGSVPRLLGDATDDFAETTAQVAQQGGDEVDSLKSVLNTGSRADPVSGSLGDLGKASHSTGRVGSAKKRLADMGEERKVQAAEDYGDFYELDADEWAKIVDDTVGLPGNPRDGRAAGLQAVISDIRRAAKNPATLAVLEDAFKDPSAASSLQKSFRGGKGKRPKGTYDFTLQEILDNPQIADARDIDTLHRALKLAQANALKTDGNLGKILGDVATELDNSVAKHSEAYRIARGNYRLRSRKMDAYENGTKNYTNRADLKDAHDNSWKVAKDQGRTLTETQKNEIKAEFRQAKIDTIADRARSMDDAAAADYIEKQFKMLFDGPDAPFAGAGGTTEAQRRAQATLLERVRTNLRSRSSQAATGRRVDASKGTGLVKETAEVSGSVPATAGLYGLAGQYGAMARTGVASLIYGKGQQRKYAQALAKRLQQTESKGLLDVAETLKGTERRRLAGLLGERGLAAGGAAATQGYATADVLGGGLLGEQRYSGVRR